MPIQLLEDAFQYAAAILGRAEVGGHGVDGEHPEDDCAPIE